MTYSSEKPQHTDLFLSFIIITVISKANYLFHVDIIQNNSMNIHCLLYRLSKPSFSAHIIMAGITATKTKDHTLTAEQTILARLTFYQSRMPSNNLSPVKTNTWLIRSGRINAARKHSYTHYTFLYIYIFLALKLCLTFLTSLPVAQCQTF